MLHIYLLRTTQDDGICLESQSLPHRWFGGWNVESRRDKTRIENKCIELWVRQSWSRQRTYSFSCVFVEAISCSITPHTDITTILKASNVWNSYQEWCFWARNRPQWRRCWRFREEASNRRLKVYTWVTCQVQTRNFTTKHQSKRTTYETGSEDYERKMREAVKFIPSNAFAGAKPGYEFRTGPNGLGYYLTTYKEEKGYSYELHFDEASQRPYVLLFDLKTQCRNTLETQVLVQ